MNDPDAALAVLDGLTAAINRRMRWLGWMDLKEERRVMRAYRYLQVRKARAVREADFNG